MLVLEYLQPETPNIISLLTVYIDLRVRFPSDWDIHFGGAGQRATAFPGGHQPAAYGIAHLRLEVSPVWLLRTWGVFGGSKYEVL